jgi:murein DD-endopeptidase MepM/ murein hydrolase activator NlpD
MEQSDTTSDKFKMLVTAKMKEKAGNELEIEDSVELAPVHSSKKDIQNVETVLTEVCDVISYKQKAIAINVNGEQLVIVANQEIADKVCQKALDAYEVPAGTQNPEFADNVDTAEVYVEGSSVSGENVALSKMTEMKPEERTHTVVAGESFGTIATNFNMTQDELLALNSNLTKDDVKTLKIGQAIKVTVKVPVVAIKTTQTVTSEEEIPFTSKVIENANEKKTYRKVITEGKNGTKEVTAEVTFINGIKSSTKVISEKVITEAVNEEVEVGTLGDEEAMPASGNFIFPVTGTISSVFGPRNYGNGKHFGVDIAASAGSPVHAADTGTVTFAGWNSGGYGNLVIIDHGNGFVTYYAHNSQLCVNKGDKVNQGTTIALVGTTGDSTGNHCHFEVVHNGQKVDPFNYLSMN